MIYDLIVVGGGPAGVCAAVAAARNGAKVALVEKTAMLGGMATSGLVGPFMTCYNREGDFPVVGGLFREIVERLMNVNGALCPDVYLVLPAISLAVTSPSSATLRTAMLCSTRSTPALWVARPWQTLSPAVQCHRVSRP